MSLPSFVGTVPPLDKVSTFKVNGGPWLVSNQVLLQTLTGGKTRLSPFQKLKGVFEMRVVHSSTLWCFSELGCVIYKIPSYGFICHEIRAICWSQYNASQTQCRPAVHRQLLVCGGGRTIITISRTPSSVDCVQYKVCQVVK